MLTSYVQIARDYRRIFGAAVLEERRWFAAPMLSGAEAVERAALCLVPSPVTGRIILHPHQRRLGHDVLAAAATILAGLVDDLEAAPDFVTILAIVDGGLRAVPGIGDLTIYDIAHRIGMRGDRAPQVVHLHAGTRVGAIALGILPSTATVSVSQLPAGLRTLPAAELEDVLCIYAADIKAIEAAKADGMVRPLIRRSSGACRPPKPCHIPTLAQ